MKQRIIITGGTGLVGSYLTKRLKDKYDLIILTRRPYKYINTATVKYIEWDGKTVIPEIIDGSYAVVNLIGENIGKKGWGDHQKKVIMKSRKEPANAISESIKICDNKPAVWIQASATGYYGQETGTVFDENSPKAKNSFLARVCDEWEKPIKLLNDDKIRKVIIRTGVILAPNASLWKQLNMSFNFRVAAIVGNGRQYLPWIHIDDEVNAVISILENNWTDVFNLVAPQGATMRQIIEAIKTKRKSIVTINIPKWFLYLLFGKEKTDEIVLTDQHIKPQHLLENGFVFKYPSINDAVNNLVD